MGVLSPCHSLRSRFPILRSVFRYSGSRFIPKRNNFRRLTLNTAGAGVVDVLLSVPFFKGIAQKWVLHFLIREDISRGIVRGRGWRLSCREKDTEF